LDIAKNVFQVYGIDAAKEVVVRKQLRRGQVMNFFEALPPCLIGMEACATAHSIDCNSAASCSGVRRGRGRIVVRHEATRAECGR
jgi:hypothetical protein